MGWSSPSIFEPTMSVVTSVVELISSDSSPVRSVISNMMPSSVSHVSSSKNFLVFSFLHNYA